MTNNENTFVDLFNTSTNDEIRAYLLSNGWIKHDDKIISVTYQYGSPSQIFITLQPRMMPVVLNFSLDSEPKND